MMVCFVFSFQQKFSSSVEFYLSHCLKESDYYCENEQMPSLWIKGQPLCKYCINLNQTMSILGKKKKKKSSSTRVQWTNAILK